MPALRSHKSVASSALQAMLVAAYAVDPLDLLICPVAKDRYSTMFHLIPAALAVLRMAAEIEPEPAEVLRWYRTTCIEHLGHLTPEKLVALGRAEQVIGFLEVIRDHPFD